MILVSNKKKKNSSKKKNVKVILDESLVYSCSLNFFFFFFLRYLVVWIWLWWNQDSFSLAYLIFKLFYNFSFCLLCKWGKGARLPRPTGNWTLKNLTSKSLFKHIFLLVEVILFLRFITMKVVFLKLYILVKSMCICTDTIKYNYPNHSYMFQIILFLKKKYRRGSNYIWY